MIAISQTTEYQDGQRAFGLGGEIDRNPYDRIYQNVSFTYWLLGFSEAQAYSISRNVDRRNKTGMTT